MIYTITIGGCTTRVRITPETEIDGVPASEYYGGNHNFNGVRGVAVVRAVEKLFGKNCFWFGQHDDLYHGQVFEALRPSKNNSNPGNSSVTKIVSLDIETA